MVGGPIKAYWDFSIVLKLDNRVQHSVSPEVFVDNAGEFATDPQISALRRATRS
jgi:hypothetical protein